MEGGVILDAIRSFFGMVDRTVFGLISVIYHIVMDLASAKIMSSEVIEDLYTRLYTLLGIFMLFKITFSFINYIINPDSFLDKTKGVQNIIKNVIIVLVLIIITPFAFDSLYKLQDAIINDNLIPAFIMGEETLDRRFKMSPYCGEQASVVTDEGDYMAVLTLKPFFQLSPEGEAEVGKEGNKSDTANAFLPHYCPLSNDVNPSTYIDSFVFNTKDKDDYYYVNYRIFIATIVGIVVFLLFVTFAFDFAIRTIKLAFLQMIAPVPIMSYIDPASGKNGMFQKWIKQVLTTWASLFIRLIALYFAILIISLFDVNVVKESTSSEYMNWVMLFLFIGALMFAKQAPRLIEELIPGMKMGAMELNPFKRISRDAVGGKTLLGLGGAGIGMAAGATSFLGSHIKDAAEFAGKRREYKKADANYKAAENRWRAYNQSITDRHNAGQISDAQFARYSANNDAKLSTAKDARDKLSAYSQPWYKQKRFRPGAPLVAGIGQTLTGAKLGYGTAHGGKMPNIVEIGKKSSKVRDYRYSYPLGERIKETTTDFFGIKNESGTTSIISGDIKKQEEILTRINRNIEMMNRQFSDLGTRMGASEFSRAVSMRADGRYELNSGYNGTYLSDIRAILDNMNTLEAQRLDTTKEIKRLQKIKDKTPGDKK